MKRELHKLVDLRLQWCRNQMNDREVPRIRLIDNVIAKRRHAGKAVGSGTTTAVAERIKEPPSATSAGSVPYPPLKVASGFAELLSIVIKKLFRTEGLEANCVD